MNKIVSFDNVTAFVGAGGSGGNPYQENVKIICGELLPPNTIMGGSDDGNKWVCIGIIPEIHSFYKVWLLIDRK